MTTYYVDFINGNNANNGLGPDASHASNKPWKTIAKLLGASGMASGDTAYLSPAGPFREVVTVAMTSATVETKVIGDVANEQGFKTSGGVLVTPGEVQWTAYTTNDKTAASTTAVLDLSARDHLTFSNIVFVGANVNRGCVEANTQTSTDITFTDCTFIQYGAQSRIGIGISIAFGVSANWLFDRCRFIKTNAVQVVAIQLATGSGSDYDANIVFRNCLIFGGGTGDVIAVTGTGASAQEGGGVDVLNCTLIGYGTMLLTSTTTIGGATFTNPCTLYNSFVMSTGAASVNAAESGAIVEDYNILYSSTTHTNVTPGTHTIANGSYAPLFHSGQEVAWVGRTRPVGMPTIGSPLLAFGGNGPPSVDILGIPRPSGGASALTSVGAFERNDSFGKETTTVRTGSNAISITGPGTQDFELPVDAASTTVTIYVRWDATYAGTKPQMKVLRGTECGVSDASTTATGSSGAWEQLSLNFTPVRAGIVTIRLQSNDTNGGGKMFADDWAVT